MAQILSQEEIDAIINSMADGEEETAAETAPEEAVETSIGEQEKEPSLLETKFEDTSSESVSIKDILVLIHLLPEFPKNQDIACNPMIYLRRV